MFITLTLVGLIGGVIVGIVGTGSSLLILPILIGYFPHYFNNYHLGIHIAVGTCIAALSIAALTKTYKVRQHLDWVLIRKLAIPMIIGAAIGVSINAELDPAIIKSYVGLIALIATLQMVFKKEAKKSTTSGTTVKSWLLVLAGTITATISGTAGVALGIFLIPVLDRLNFDLRAAVASNICLSSIYTISCTCGYIVSGYFYPGVLPDWSLGYVYLPAFFTLATTIFIGVYFSSIFEKWLSKSLLRKVFISYLFLASIDMIFHIL